MQPLQYHLRDPAAKDNSMTHAGAVPSNLDAAITMRSAETELRNGFGNCSSKTGSRRQTEKKTILKHFSKGILKGKLIAPKFRKSTDKSLSQPSCSHSNTFMCPCLFSADNATRKNIRKKKHTYFYIVLHFLTFSCAFKRLLFVLLSSNSGLCEASLGTLPWMPAMDVPVLMLP